jgi:superfamily I DNA/RNA helicase
VSHAGLVEALAFIQCDRNVFQKYEHFQKHWHRINNPEELGAIGSVFVAMYKSAFMAVDAGDLDAMLDELEQFADRICQEKIRGAKLFAALLRSIRFLTQKTNGDINKFVFSVERMAQGSSKKTEPSECDVMLYTMHASKGLQWPYVWITGNVSSEFPSPRSVEEMGHDFEERRLCYVALTRAEERVVMTSFNASEDKRHKGGYRPELPGKFYQDLVLAQYEPVVFERDETLFSKHEAVPA